MSIRKIKKRNSFRRKTNYRRKVFKMKFVELYGDLYPLNDRVIFKIKNHPNGLQEIYLLYTDGGGSEILVGDVTNQKILTTEKKVEIALKGKIREINIFH
ncbi:hypothetical protein CLU92_5369 [Janthinobacterium sp. 61]|uniref:hypothetical protein n=1 Tax=Janthinobacterium sp. 61 TaxID=2035209 RepID=UPI000C7070E1|nr:hypothetical protein [Janthinobacterium sp. 61]PKV47895.1 hypothetical protein CLU92_5369 [Janthinobacterium sp. 61]